MKPFKFLRPERVFTDYMNQMDDYFLGNIQGQLVNAIRDLQQEPPYGLSRRHWNLLPQSLRNAPERDMTDYLDGWEARRNNNLNNSHHSDLHRAELWNRGFWDCSNRIRTNDQAVELREQFDNIFDNEPQIHRFCVGRHNTPLRLEYEGGMDIESVNAMTWTLKYRYASYVSINEQVIGFMQDYLNEHLSGTSRIRLA